MKYLLLLILLIPCFSCFAQLRISDTTDFQLVYEERATPGWGVEEYNFVDNYFVRENLGEVNVRLNGEKVIQIGDFESRILFKYFTESKNLVDNFLIPSEITNYRVVTKNDTVIDGNDILHLTLVSNTRNTLADITITDVFYLKNLVIPEKYRSIKELYNWQNNLFLDVEDNIIYRLISEFRGDKIVDLQLKEINKSDYSLEEVQSILGEKR